MKIVESEALVLQVMDLQERDRIVTFVTAAHGRKRGVAKGARARFSRFQGVLQSLAEVQITWAEKAGRELVRIRDASLIRGANRTPADLERLMVGQYLAESIDRFTVEDEPAELEVRLLRSCIRALEDGAPVAPLLRYFEVWLLQIAGIFTLEGACPVCGEAFGGGAVLPDDADAVVCRSCAAREGLGGRVVPHEALEFIAGCSRTRPADLEAADPLMLARVEDLAREIRRRFLGVSLRSYEVMKRTLDEVGPA